MSLDLDFMSQPKRLEEVDEGFVRSSKALDAVFRLMDTMPDP